MDDKVDAFLKWFFGACANSWKWLCDTTVKFYKATGKADFDCDFEVTFILAILVLLLLGSACWAASIAACRRHNAFVHFVLGLILPWIYPVFILFTLDVKGAKEMKLALEKQKEEAEAAEAERQKNIQMNSGTEAKEEEPESEWNQARFEKMARNPDGSLAGPWDVKYGGRQVRVLHILEAFPEMVSVEFEDPSGNKLKIRIPYAKIESWEDA